MKKEIVLKLYILLSIVSWLSLTLIDILPLSTFGLEVKYSVLNTIRGSIMSLLSIFIFLYFKFSIGLSQWEKFTDFLWNVVATGLLTIIINIIIILLEKQVFESYISDKFLLLNFLNHLQLVLLLVFVSKGFFVWKKMILYQKTRLRLQVWNIFEGIIYTSLFFSLWEHKYSFYVIFFLVVSFILGIILSFNVKWVAFLNFKQKWQSILFIALILLISLIFLTQILNDLKNPFIIINLSTDIFLILIFGFLIIYAGITFLVLLFNLPTSSVFEQKFEESLNFQKISQSIDIYKSEKDIYEILFESSLKTVMADNGWIEWTVKNEKHILPEFISDKTVKFAKDILKEIPSINFKKPIFLDNLPEKIVDLETGVRYASAIVVPIQVGEKIEAQMVLLKDVKDGFDKEMLNIINSYAVQTGISIENLRLLKNAVENERFKEDLLIAKEVKNRLMPEKSISNPNFEFYAFSNSAEDVGGDYYDVIQLEEHKFAFVIADVSGHGISAAFNMAQLKGALNAILYLKLPIKSIFKILNKAISASIEKNAFISISYFELNISTKSIYFYQGGHCPALYFNSETQTADYIKDYGVALGIIRSEKYENVITNKSVNFNKDDILLLYTDGIVEAKNKEKEEFGYDNLIKILNKNNTLSAVEIGNKIKQEVADFSNSEILVDDMTLICVKF